MNFDEQAKQIDSALDTHLAGVLYGGLGDRSLATVHAAQFLLAQKIEESTGHNDGLPQWLFNHGEALPWCAAFVLYVLKKAHCLIAGNIYEMRNCEQFAKQFQSISAFLSPSTEPLPGDVAFYYGRPGSDSFASNGIHHCGIVEVVRASDMQVIEGNFGNRIARVTRQLDSPQIAGYGRP